MELEEFGVSVEEEELEGIETAGAAFDLIRAAQGRRRLPRASASSPCAASASRPSGRPGSPGRHPATATSMTDPSPYFENPRTPPTDRFSQFEHSRPRPSRAGEPASTRPAWSLVGTGIGGTTETQIVVQHEKGDRRVSPFLVPMMMPNAAAASISMKYGLQGLCEATVTACAAGTHAIGNAARAIADGRCDAMVAGGSEAPMTPTARAGFANMTALSNSGVSRPFSADRDGFVIAEGCGLLILEEWGTRSGSHPR